MASSPDTDMRYASKTNPGQAADEGTNNTAPQPSHSQDKHDQQTRAKNGAFLHDMEALAAKRKLAAQKNPIPPSFHTDGSRYREMWEGDEDIEGSGPLAVKR